jgi:hypothetical protein
VALRRLVAAPLAVLALGLWTGCGADDRTARSHEIVSPTTPDPLLGSGIPPAGFLVAQPTVISPHAERTRVVLYGEPDRPDVMAGRVIVVASTRATALGGSCTATGRVRRCGSWSVVVGIRGLVVGRNVDDATLASVASRRDRALPDGMRPLVSAPLSIVDLSAPGAEILTYHPTRAGRLRVVAVAGGSALADLYRFFIGPDGVLASDATDGAVRIRGDTVIAVLGAGVERRALERFASSLRGSAFPVGVEGAA